MAEYTGITWASHTFNPWIGCEKVSPACDHCYAEAVGKRLQVTWGIGKARKLTSDANWLEPMRWDRRAAASGIRERVFCASLSDVFDKAASPAWRTRLFRLIAATPHLDWLLLTKRVGNVAAMLPLDWCGGYANVWLGISVVTQAEVCRDVPKLLALPAAQRFLSCEPLLGPIDLTAVRWRTPSTGRKITLNALDRSADRAAIDWVIVGGESGVDARPMHPDWARDLQTQCATAGTPFFFKQWGEWVPRGPQSLGYPLVEDVPRIRLTDRGHDGQRLGAAGGNDVWMQKVGKKAAGCLLDGSLAQASIGGLPLRASVVTAEVAS